MIKYSVRFWKYLQWRRTSMNVDCFFSQNTQKASRAEQVITLDYDGGGHTGMQLPWIQHCNKDERRRSFSAAASFTPSFNFFSFLSSYNLLLTCFMFLLSPPTQATLTTPPSGFLLRTCNEEERSSLCFAVECAKSVCQHLSGSISEHSVSMSESYRE